MEASLLNYYARVPASGNFPVTEKDKLPVTWNKSVFTGRFFGWFDEELERLLAPLKKEQKRLLEVCEALAKDEDDVKAKLAAASLVDAATLGENGRKTHEAECADLREQKEAIQAKAREMSRKLTKLRSDVEQAQADLYARAFVGPLPFGLGRVLLDWRLTEGGKPVDLTFEYLRLQSVEFLASLLAFCRIESLPKAVEKKTESPSDGLRSETTHSTTASSSKGSRNTRRRKGPQGLSSPQTSPSSESSAAPSST